MAVNVEGLGSIPKAGKFYNLHFASLGSDGTCGIRSGKSGRRCGQPAQGENHLYYPCSECGYPCPSIDYRLEHLSAQHKIG